MKNCSENTREAVFSPRSNEDMKAQPDESVTGNQIGTGTQVAFFQWSVQFSSSISFVPGTEHTDWDKRQGPKESTSVLCVVNNGAMTPYSHS